MKRLICLGLVVVLNAGVLCTAAEEKEKKERPPKNLTNTLVTAVPKAYDEFFKFGEAPAWNGKKKEFTWVVTAKMDGVRYFLQANKTIRYLGKDGVRLNNAPGENMLRPTVEPRNFDIGEKVRFTITIPASIDIAAVVKVEIQ